MTDFSGHFYACNLGIFEDFSNRDFDKWICDRMQHECGMLPYNGGCINRVGEDTPLIASRMPFEVVERLFNHAVFLGDIGMHIYTQSGDVWGWNITPSEPGRICRAMFSTMEMSADCPLPPNRFLRHQSKAAAPHCTVPQT